MKIYNIQKSVVYYSYLHREFICNYVAVVTTKVSRDLLFTATKGKEKDFGTKEH